MKLSDDLRDKIAENRQRKVDDLPKEELENSTVQCDAKDSSLVKSLIQNDPELKEIRKRACQRDYVRQLQHQIESKGRERAAQREIDAHFSEVHNETCRAGAWFAERCAPSAKETRDDRVDNVDVNKQMNSTPAKPSNKLVFTDFKSNLSKNVCALSRCESKRSLDAANRAQAALTLERNSPKAKNSRFRTSRDESESAGGLRLPSERSDEESRADKQKKLAALQAEIGALEESRRAAKLADVLLALEVQKQSEIAEQAKRDTAARETAKRRAEQQKIGEFLKMQIAQRDSTSEKCRMSEKVTLASSIKMDADVRSETEVERQAERRKYAAELRDQMARQKQERVLSRLAEKQAECARIERETAEYARLKDRARSEILTED